ncbi:hypothetical protein CGRA01v4_00500 [Colletotrichum graminicola]|uniref:Uncharacterized protein n=1 Tax=Colletotrichum graminicola (strain M1.001 / M2 / FGSC 10212) TaxID=645133 RepID=E3QQ81_COLGM|nr:uncharacterized protein GLRG_08163 [Colletotrichum graminicola M1.001]EFQ33019.1 hypothetical protein GLRG_08163 [Colletotrichum graminicola M1.001]WDK09222.1 hypothetical protein CGRA01v4_00500 [Colletotrichum graminicola]
MKTSIIKALIVALVAGVEVAEACALYHTCRCTMADGSINNTITEQACARELANTRGASGDNTQAYQITKDTNSTEWCNWGFNGKTAFYVDNCSFRESCTAWGATGSDSWCEDKQD